MDERSPRRILVFARKKNSFTTVTSHIGLILFAILPAFAQTGGVRGRVLDSSGAAVAGANVVLSASTPAQTKTTQADATGNYSFGGLPQGDYSITASAPGLGMPQPSKIGLRDRIEILDLRLRIIIAGQQVTVQDDAPAAVSTDAANNAGAVVLKGNDLDALADNPEDLQADLEALAGPSAGPGGGSIFIDGFSGGQLPAKSSIREVRINQNPFSPENDKLGLGRIEIFTKPGTDQYHASIPYNLGTDWWNSRNPYAAAKGRLLLNEFENSGGGPLTKRSSFTLTLERQVVDNGSIVNAVILDPRTLTPSPFTATLTAYQRRWNVSPRVDYQLSENHTLSVRYAFVYSTLRDTGLGGFDLASRATYHQNFYNTVQVTETAVKGSRVNETRFQYYRWHNDIQPNSSDPALLVLGAFNSGGSQQGHASDLQNSYELQNYTTSVSGSHTVRFGLRLRAQTDDSVAPQNYNGAYTFSGVLAPQLDSNNRPIPGSQVQISALEQYRRTLLFQGLGYPPAAIRTLGGGASQLSISAGNSEVSGSQIDVGLFAGDDWRIRPNLTLNLGVRYEIQNNIGDHSDIAPRLGIAWAPRAGGAKQPKTVIRAGFGMFYDRFGLGGTLNALRYNGVRVQQYVVKNPDFYPAIPSIASLANSSAPQVTRQVDSNLRSPYFIQSALTLERELPTKSTLSITYTNSHALHVFRSLDVNAPIPGTGVFPLGTPNPLFLATSSGQYDQHQVLTTVNMRINGQISLTGTYVWNKALANSDGLGTFPANHYNYAGEYGPASNDIRHRVQIQGSINTRWNVRLNPNITIQTGAPYDLTTGTDFYGTTLFNARPGFATDPSLPGLIQTPYGLLDPNPTPAERLVPRNYGRGPAQMSLNTRIGKTFTFGKETSASKGSGIFAAPASRRYNLGVSMSIRNLLNHTNPGPIIGNITSPLFGRANQMSGTTNGEGFSENANNRRLELQVRLQF